MGEVAYSLRLLSSSRIHPTFHVLCLKRKVVAQIQPQAAFPQVDVHGEILPKLESIEDHHMKYHGNRAVKEVLIKWTNATKKDNR